jgi:hypothetical protein
MQTAYLTDLEGQWQKFESFCDGNPLVWFDGDQLTLAADARFVFGGDAIDRGPHGMRIVRVLTRAKRRYGDRVVLLAGNRDINKLRLARELRGHPPTGAPDPVLATRSGLLRWIFERTMGAPSAFEHRQSELSQLGRPVEDEEVVESFLGDVTPTGALTRYLTHCQLAYREGRTLFVHGGVGDESLGIVPSRDGFEAVLDLDEWVARLNAWYGAQLQAFVAGALEQDGTPMWQPLVAYQAPSPGMRSNPRSVVYARLANEHNDPRLPSPNAVERLGAQGVRRLVVGHMPAGDTPALLRDPSRGFELLLADNSHGRVQVGSRVSMTDDAVHVAGEVVLDDGSRHRVDYAVAADEPSDVGLHLPNGGPLIKGPIEHSFLTFRALPGYAIEQRRVGVTWRRSDLVVPYRASL